MINDAKGVIKNRKSMDQTMLKEKNTKRLNNGPENITQKTKD